MYFYIFAMYSNYLFLFYSKKKIVVIIEHTKILLLGSNEQYKMNNPPNMGYLISNNNI